MAKLDLKKESKELYNPSKKEVSMVEVPEMKFLMMDGKGRSQHIPGIPGCNGSIVSGFIQG